MWAARRAGVPVRDLAAAVGMSKSQVSRRYKAV
jgi:DNA-binding Lrp family transcriptional regulator